MPLPALLPQRLCEHDFEVSVLEFSPDNRLLLSIGNHKCAPLCLFWKSAFPLNLAAKQS